MMSLKQLWKRYATQKATNQRLRKLINRRPGRNPGWERQLKEGTTKARRYRSAYRHAKAKRTLHRFDQARVSYPWLYLLRTARKEGWKGTLYGPMTGARTYAQQLTLWLRYKAGTGAPAFPPTGPSRHLWRNVRRKPWAMAVDTNDVDTLIRIAKRHGITLHRPYPHENWHVESRYPFKPPRNWRP